MVCEAAIASDMMLHAACATWVNTHKMCVGHCICTRSAFMTTKINSPSMWSTRTDAFAAQV